MQIYSGRISMCPPTVMSISNMPSLYCTVLPSPSTLPAYPFPCSWAAYGERVGHKLNDVNAVSTLRPNETQSLNRLDLHTHPPALHLVYLTDYNYRGVPMTRGDIEG